MLPGEFHKRCAVYSYFAKWSEPDQDEINVLEQALKKSGWLTRTNRDAAPRRAF